MENLSPFFLITAHKVNFNALTRDLFHAYTTQNRPGIIANPSTTTTSPIVLIYSVQSVAVIVARVRGAATVVCVMYPTVAKFSAITCFTVCLVSVVGYSTVAVLSVVVSKYRFPFGFIINVSNTGLNRWG